MEPFLKDEAKLFLRRYLRAHVNPDGQGHLASPDTDWIEARVAEFNDIKQRDELLRPVHLKIFSDIATDRSITLRDFSIFELYNIATTRISEREAEKAERAFIDSDVRQSCVEAVAWWLWERSDGRALSFSPRDVPPHLIDGAFQGNTEISAEGMYREIFSGPFVERKFGENYYFSHRSFLEFFVAKKLARSREHKFSLGLVGRNLNPEIISFMSEGKLLTPFLNYVLETMQSFSGELEFYLLESVQKHIEATRKNVSEMQISVQMVLRYLLLYANETIDGLTERAARMSEEDFASGNKERIETALFFAADLVRANLGKRDIQELAIAVAKQCFNEVNWKHWRQEQRRREAQDNVVPRLAFSRANIPEFVFLRNARIAAELDASGSPILLVDFERIYSDLYTVRKPRIVFAGREPATSDPANPLRFTLRSITSSPDEAAVAVLREGVRIRIGS